MSLYSTHKKVTTSLPLFIRYAEIGVVSWGMNTCVGKPGVFSRVSEYKDWIKSVASGTLDSKCRQ